MPTNKRGRALNRSLTALNKAKKLWLASPQGFDLKTREQLFDIAHRALAGVALSTDDV